MSFFTQRIKIIHTDDKELLLDTACEMGEYLIERESSKQFIYVQTSSNSEYKSEFVDSYIKNGGSKEDISYFDIHNRDEEDLGMCVAFPTTKIVIMDAITLGAYYAENQCSEILIKSDVTSITEAEIFIEDFYEFYIALVNYERDTARNGRVKAPELLYQIWRKCNYADKSSIDLVEMVKQVTLGRNLAGCMKEVELFKQGWLNDTTEQSLPMVYDLKWFHLPEENKEVMVRKNTSKEFVFDRMLELCKTELERAYPGMSNNEIKEEAKKISREFTKHLEKTGLNGNYVVPAYGNADTVCCLIMAKCNIVALADIAANDQTVFSRRWEIILAATKGIGSKTTAYTANRKAKDDLPVLELYVNQFIDRYINGNEEEVTLGECEFFMRYLQGYAETNVISFGFKEYLLQMIFGSKRKVNNIKLPLGYERWEVQNYKELENQYARYLINISLCCSNTRSASMLWNCLKDIALKNPTGCSKMRGSGIAPDYLYNEIRGKVREKYLNKSDLEIIMKNPYIKTLFMVKGYATSFEQGDCIISEPMLEIYKQALADEVGKYLFSLRSMELAIPRNAQQWALSQNKLEDGNLVIFKNWKDTKRLKKVSTINSFFEQMEKLDVNTIYIYNLIGDGTESRYTKKEKTIVVIEGMLDVNGNIIREESK